MMTTLNSTIEKAARPRRAAAKPTRQKQLYKMLARKSGVTIAQLQKAFGWQPLTARAAISVQRKACCVIERAETEKGSVYRIVEAQGTQ